MEIKTIIIDTNAYTEFKKGDKDALEIIRIVNNILITPIVLGELIAGFVLGKKQKRIIRVHVNKTSDINSN